MNPARSTADRAFLEPSERVGAAFFEQPVLTLARNLLGTYLIHRSRQGITAGRIIETEAYRGPEDLAAHSRRGLRTQRTEAMFGPAGRVYMFLLYGTSWAFNIVAGGVGEPHAVLVRALEPVFGLPLMGERRGPQRTRTLTNGPGKLCQAMALGREHYGAALDGPNLYLAHGSSARIARTARINVDYAGRWASKPWRFIEIDNPWLSVKPSQGR